MRFLRPHTQNHLPPPMFSYPDASRFISLTFRNGRLPAYHMLVTSHAKPLLYTWLPGAQGPVGSLPALQFHHEARAKQPTL